MKNNIDWQSLIFTSGWLDRLDRLAIRRFGEGGLAEEASRFVLDQLSDNDWSVLDSYKGKSKPETYLYTLSGNFLEEFSRRRFGRPRPPEWLKRQGDIWVQVWKLVCLERQLIQTVVDRLTWKGLREPGFVKKIIRTIKARLPWCGKSNREMPVVPDDPGHPAGQNVPLYAVEAFATGGEGGLPNPATPDPVEVELSSATYDEVLLMVGSLLNDEVNPNMFNTGADDKALYISAALTAKIDRLRDQIHLSDEERLILRMVYQEGMKRKLVAQALGMQEHLPGRILKRVIGRIKDIFSDIGIDMNEIRELMAT